MLSVMTDRSAADASYADLLACFWEGKAATGHLLAFARRSSPYSGAIAPGSTTTAGAKISTGSLWEYGNGARVIYAYWKLTGSPDALLRLKALLNWVKYYWSPAQISVCGAVANTTNTAQDDAAWHLNCMLDLYDATGDTVALSYAQSIIDAAWARWYNPTWGALYYDDSLSTLSSYQSFFAYGCLRYYLATGAATYLGYATTIENFAWNVLAANRNGDNLFWCNVNAADGSPVGQLSHIGEAGSSSFMAGNMIFAALDAALYNVTGTASYKTKALAISAGMRAKQTMLSKSGTVILLNDRDAYQNGSGAYIYVKDVIPELDRAQPYIDASVLLNTARSCRQNARNGDGGTINPAWDGTVAGNAAWSLSNGGAGAPSYLIKVSSHGMLWPIVAAQLA